MTVLKITKGPDKQVEKKKEKKRLPTLSVINVSEIKHDAKVTAIGKNKL